MYTLYGRSFGDAVDQYTEKRVSVSNTWSVNSDRIVPVPCVLRDFQLYVLSDVLRELLLRNKYLVPPIGKSVHTLYFVLGFLKVGSDKGSNFKLVSRY
jgi:hypothetical protein